MSDVITVLKSQLDALESVIKPRTIRGGNVHWEVGETLNSLRNEIIRVLPDYKSQIVERTLTPLLIDKNPSGGSYTVSSLNALRFCVQLRGFLE